MSKFKIVCLSIIAVALLINLFVVNTPVAAGEVKFWAHYHPPRIERNHDEIKRFEEANPDIKVTLEHFPYGELWDKLLPAIAAGTGPDFIHVHGSWTTLFVQSNAWEAIPEDVLSKDYIEEYWLPSSLPSYYRDGEYYGLPYATGGEGVYLNVDLFSEVGLDANQPPKTWPEAIEAGKKLTKFDEAGKMMQSGWALIDSHLYWDTTLFQFGTDIITPDGKKAAFNNPQGVAAFKWRRDFITEHKLQNFEFLGAYEAFQQAKAAMACFGPWYGDLLVKDYPDVKFTTSLVPVLKEGDDPVVSTIGGGWGYAVNSRSKNKEDTWEFFKFMVSKEEQIFMFMVEGNPVRKDVIDDPKIPELVEKTPYFKAFIDSMPYYKYVGDKVNEMLFNRAFEMAWTSMVQEGVSPEDATAKAAADVDEVLAEKK